MTNQRRRLEIQRANAGEATHTATATATAWQSAMLEAQARLATEGIWCSQHLTLPSFS